MRYILTLFLTFFLTNCVAAMKPEDFKDQKPRLVIEEFLQGNVKAYGILQNQRLFLLAVSGIVVVIAAFFYRLIVSTAWSKWGLVFIMIGTIGNSLDRLLLGYVVDFIDITIIPVFNIADISINIGVICFIIEMISISRKNKS